MNILNNWNSIHSKEKLEDVKWIVKKIVNNTSVLKDVSADIIFNLIISKDIIITEYPSDTQFIKELDCDCQHFYLLLY